MKKTITALLTVLLLCAFSVTEARAQQNFHRSELVGEWKYERSDSLIYSYVFEKDDSGALITYEPGVSTIYYFYYGSTYDKLLLDFSYSREVLDVRLEIISKDYIKIGSRIYERKD